MLRRGVWILSGTVLVGAVLFWGPRPVNRPPLPPSDPDSPGDSVGAGATDKTEPAPVQDDVRSHAFRIPSGRAPSLTCDAARLVVAQAREQLGFRPEPVDVHALADAAADWLDPYGLWSVAPDAPVEAAFERSAPLLLGEIEGRGSRTCRGARAIGAALSRWLGELAVIFDRARAATSNGDFATAVSASAFEGATVTLPARTLAATLGQRVGVVERGLGEAGHNYAEAARSRYFPALDPDGWAAVVLAAAVRAYVPAVDPHGAWAPLEEESSVYEVDLEAKPPARLWDKAERTAVGVRIESGAVAPFADGDVLLSLAGVPTAGLSYEQIEQLGYAASETRPAARADVLRAGTMTPVSVTLDDDGVDSVTESATADAPPDLPVERVAYGEGDAVVVTIRDVRDDLGDELTRTLLREREREHAGGRPVAGFVLDLRGNGGGSTDGAIDALGLFIPGAPLFPMRRRDGSLETDRAPEPPNVDRWTGPIAALVDSDTASAAEMLAGALAAYHRGATVGERTFGKGCAQEYIDDDAHAGVLRLTTLLYALPDGSPVQRVGLTPTLRFRFGTPDPSDREAALVHAPPTWRGPDVRDRAVLAHAEDGAWATSFPAPNGNVGPCREAELCRALRLLGTGAPTARRTTPIKGR